MFEMVGNINKTPLNMHDDDDDDAIPQYVTVYSSIMTLNDRANTLKYKIKHETIL